jgi:hypothetical protein
VPRLPNRGGYCTGTKVFDTFFLREEEAREGSKVSGGQHHGAASGPGALDAFLAKTW